MNAKAQQLPRFKSYEEEAEFWDTHSPEDFPNEFEDVEVEFVSAYARREITPEERRNLVRALSGLREPERQALTLMLLGLSASEIARVMGWSAKDTERVLDDARKRIAAFSLKVS